MSFWILIWLIIVDEEGTMITLYWSNVGSIVSIVICYNGAERKTNNFGLFFEIKHI